MITAKELRQKYLDFFESKGHKIIPSASLIPENDPTVLFTTAGMHPLIPYIMGQPHPEGNKLVDVQKCVRTGDIDEVGDNRHLTFFEMMGNWSLGAYFKKEAVEWSYEFLTGEKWLGLDPKRLYITVFRGEGEIGRDDESIKIWQEQFKSKHNIDAKAAGDDAVWSDLDVRIFALPKEDNFWEMGGEGGPCGPCTEIFYDTKPEKGFEKKTFEKLTNEFRFLEIWNNVFMSYIKFASGEYELLKQKNVDTGMGVERTLAALNGLEDVFDTELFTPILKKIEENMAETQNFASLRPEDKNISKRIIADHIKAAVMILADDKRLIPSNIGRGYVLRRLIRRAVRHGRILGIEKDFIIKIAESVIEMYQDVYEEAKYNKGFILGELLMEEEKFQKTLEHGLNEFNKWYKWPVAYLEGENLKITKKREIEEFPKVMPGIVAFKLFSSFGFPIEITIEEAKSRGVEVDVEGFQEELGKHKELSRTASAGMFKSGLADSSEMTARLHTATHLLQAALREILGEHVKQRGSNITPERLRFDFFHPEKMSPEQIKKAEDWVNEAISKDLPVAREEMSIEEARTSGALGLFDSKYGNKVSVYTVKDGDKIVSREICAGPHAEHTGKIGKFKIKKEESSSQGIRRIKAIVEN